MYSPNKFLKVQDIDWAVISSQLIEELKRQKENLSRSGVVFGLSGGLDSSIVAKVCNIAFAREEIHALIMPEK